MGTDAWVVCRSNHPVHGDFLYAEFGSDFHFNAKNLSLVIFRLSGLGIPYTRTRYASACDLNEWPAPNGRDLLRTGRPQSLVSLG